jgi:hypothetical protein
MPKRSDLESILIIGAGPIVIGQACEFDYSGAQACKALREEGYRVILVNLYRANSLAVSCKGYRERGSKRFAPNHGWSDRFELCS